MANSNFIVKNGLTVGNVVIDAASGNISGVGNLALTGTITGITGIADGNSNVTIAPNSNVGISVAGNANVLVVTGTGANITGTANISGNANTGNLGTGTIIATTANLTTINSGLLQNSTSNVTVTSAGNVSTFIGGNTTAQLVVTATGANIAGTANVAGNANVGNLGTGTIIATTANLTTINSGLLQNSTSNVTVTSAGNVSVFVAGNATARTIFTSTGANIAGTANITGATAIGGALSITAQTTSYQIAPAANATYSLGNATNYWTTMYGQATTAQYADVAELYESDAPYSPGTVLDFGGTHEVTICGTPLSTRVAGVVSTNPALRMNSVLVADNKVELALLGRVPTRVVGPVSKGDMMVSAGNGYAMACSSPAIGSVIGKALEDFSAAEGIIEVVVGRL